MAQSPCQRCGLGRMFAALDEPSELLCLVCGHRAYSDRVEAARLLEWQALDPRTPEQRAADAEFAVERDMAQRKAANERRRKRERENPELREKRRAGKKAYVERHRERVRAYQREYMRQRRAKAKARDADGG